MNKAQITPIQEKDYADLVFMVGELLNEIMVKTNLKTFNFDKEFQGQRGGGAIQGA